MQLKAAEERKCEKKMELEQGFELMTPVVPAQCSFCCLHEAVAANNSFVNAIVSILLMLNKVLTSPIRMTRHGNDMP